MDAATRSAFAFSIFSLSNADAAVQFHKQFHVNSQTLRKKFKISREAARHIVTQCPDCSILHHSPGLGINPRGLRPLQLWQMDETHFLEFSTLKYVHVSVDTCSGLICASPLAGERARNVISHCLEAWAAWGKPIMLKTDNGPGYTAASFQSFCKSMAVELKHGLPYNSQGQGLVEHAHCTLKECLIKQKGGIGAGRTPKERISLPLFTLNFLQLDNDGRSAVERHTQWSPSSHGFVRWKDVITGLWSGPDPEDPVLFWSRGSVCVFPRDRPDPVWVPECLVRCWDAPDPSASADSGKSCMDGTTMGDPISISDPDARKA